MKLFYKLTKIIEFKKDQSVGLVVVVVVIQFFPVLSP